MVCKESAIYSRDKSQGRDHVCQLACPGVGVMCVMVLFSLRLQFIAGMEARGVNMCAQ